MRRRGRDAGSATLRLPLRRPAAVSDPDDDYRPIPRRRRWQVALLGIATAIAIVLLLLDPPGGVKRVRKLPPDTQRCADGQTTGCVGGTASVIVAPAASAAR